MFYSCRVKGSFFFHHGLLRACTGIFHGSRRLCQAVSKAFWGVSEAPLTPREANSYA